MPPTEIDPEEAKRLIDESTTGYVVIPRIEPRPVLGHIEPGEREADATVETYRFGDPRDLVADRR